MVSHPPQAVAFGFVKKECHFTTEVKQVETFTDAYVPTRNGDQHALNMAVENGLKMQS